MKNLLLFSFLLLGNFSLLAQAQSTALRVHQIFQTKCVSCHNNANPQSGLDLEGTGSTATEKALSVYDNLVGVTPRNSTAAHKGYKYVLPGRIDKSFLFKKINQGLDRDMELESGENAPMPMTSSLTDVEKELVRQWILFGAPKDKVVIKESLLKDFYENGMGRASFPQGAPAAPDPSEGFQVKMGPFFLNQDGEDEYYTKYQLDNEEAIEVNRIDIKMSEFSHHFIIYDYTSDAATVPDGYRRSQKHTRDVNFVSTVQESSDIALPRGTAFKWGKNHVLDLNSHTINYAGDRVYQSEVYVNVYTQPKGTAIQEIKANLVPNIGIYIPNNGNEITHTAKVQLNGDIYLWTLAGHTHQLGTGYKVWANDATGAPDELIYDASCPRGLADCVAPYYDYQHIPNRLYEGFKHINLKRGFTHEAKYINDGSKPVAWGATSKDEMMLFAMLYVTDTTGLGRAALTTPTVEVENPLEKISVMPNPMSEYTNILLPANVGEVQFSLYDMLGKEVRQLSSYNNNSIRLEKGNLTKGMYLFTVKNEVGQSFTGKIMID